MAHYAVQIFLLPPPPHYIFQIIFFPSVPFFFLKKKISVGETYYEESHGLDPLQKARYILSWTCLILVVAEQYFMDLACAMTCRHQSSSLYSVIPPFKCPLLGWWSSWKDIASLGDMCWDNAGSTSCRTGWPQMDKVSQVGHAKSLFPHWILPALAGFLIM